tara:strand:- start:268 stop:483 length:216 start_codon:yes stop_codon:yes gene_type:complete
MVSISSRNRKRTRGEESNSSQSNSERTLFTTVFATLESLKGFDKALHLDNEKKLRGLEQLTKDIFNAVGDE